MGDNKAKAATDFRDGHGSCFDSLAFCVFARARVMFNFFVFSWADYKKGQPET
jgi:hypothetical protein